MNSAAAQTQRTSNVATFAETASVTFAIDAMLTHRTGQLKMPRPDAYFRRAPLTQGQDAIERGQDGTRCFFQRDPKATGIHEALDKRPHLGECLIEFRMVLSLLDEQRIQDGAA